MYKNFSFCNKSMIKYDGIKIDVHGCSRTLDNRQEEYGKDTKNVNGNRTRRIICGLMDDSGTSERKFNCELQEMVLDDSFIGCQRIQQLGRVIRGNEEEMKARAECLSAEKRFRTGGSVRDGLMQWEEDVKKIGVQK